MFLKGRKEFSFYRDLLEISYECPFNCSAFKGGKVQREKEPKVVLFQKQRRRVKTRANNRLASVRTKVTY